MGSKTSKPDERPAELVVSRYREFITEGVTERDREQMSTVLLGEHGIMRSPRDPKIDFLTTRVLFNPLVEEISRATASIVHSFAFRHYVQHHAWKNMFQLYKQTEQVDLAGVTDWFPIFVRYVRAPAVRIDITTQLDTIKLHRVLAFLFYLGRMELTSITVAFESSLISLVEHAVIAARQEAFMLDGTGFAYIVFTNRTDDFNPDGWILTAATEGGMTNWTFKYYEKSNPDMLPALLEQSTLY